MREMKSGWRVAVRYGFPLLMVALLVAALWMSPRGAQPQLHLHTRLLMGTLVNLTIGSVPRSQADQAAQQAFAEMVRIEEVMSSHRSDSEVSRINQVSRETWQPVSGELGLLLRQGLQVTTLSQGAFAMGLEPLTRLWGFSGNPPATQPPPSADLARWLQAYPSSGAIELRYLGEGAAALQESDQSTLQVRLKTQSVGLDLGAIAKGYAVDRAVAILQQAGIKDAVVDAGGNLRIIGSKEGKPWRIGVQSPRQQDQVVAVSQLSGNMAMVTSGDYERFFLYEGKRYHHIIDPGTGLPARSGLSSVTVQAPDATTADALSTALFVLGAEKGLSLLSHFPGSAALLITEEGKPIRSAGFVGEWLSVPQ
ncbi:MAG: FAD:protein FMN transferase [Magnetococcales bacterium]|nr:FAD:protein FMN transferase [Magnetococcales bacterium]